MDVLLLALLLVDRIGTGWTLNFFELLDVGCYLKL